MTDSSEIPVVTVETAMKESSGGTILIDVREQDEWDAGHAPDAQFVPLSALQERASELPLDTRLLIVCHSGGRSLRAAGFLRSEGFDAVNVDGGMLAWAAAGGSIVVDSHTANSDKD
ncbi:MAG: rhodanese-like domain-containing protein [Rhodoglobus sp.]